MSDVTVFDELEPVVDHLNDDHRDTVLFVVRHVATARAVGIAGSEKPRDAVVDGELTRITSAGIAARSHHADGSTIDHLAPFGAEPTTMDDVRKELFSLLAAARAAEPDAPVTSLEAELTGVDGIETHLAHVVAARDVVPGLREITFGGLDGFTSLGGDEFLHLLAPPAGRDELTVGTDFTWSAYEEMDDADKPVGAYYSVRRWRPDSGEIDVWFVLHDHDGAASRWAAGATPGDPVALWGPRRSFHPPDDVTRYLLITDESGFGATASLLDQLAQDESAPCVTVVAEAADADRAVDFPAREGVTVHWLLRDGREPGVGTAFVDLVRSLDLRADGLFAFGAGESRQVTAVRRHLRDEIGLDAEHVSMTGYWRRETG